MDDFEKKECKILNELDDIKCTVVAVNGFCASGHRVGQEFIIKRQRTPEGICVSAFNSILPQYFGFVFGAEYPWEPDKNYVNIRCPDVKNGVSFRLEKIKKEVKS